MSEQQRPGNTSAAGQRQPAGGAWDSIDTQTQRVFISYRRSDCQPQANGLHDGLRHRLPSASIFMDIDSIPPGVDFEHHIRQEIEICDVVLVLIGDDWLDPRLGTNLRRIDEPDDFVRLEIESALSSPGVRVVPVLVEGAQMPRASDLPESLRNLARINAIELSDSRWTSDLERLAALVERIGRDKKPEPRNMRLVDIDADVVAAAVASLPASFRTKLRTCRRTFACSTRTWRSRISPTTAP
jgi:hypothetical protein